MSGLRNIKRGMRSAQRREKVFVACLTADRMLHESIARLSGMLPEWSRDPRSPWHFYFWVEAGSKPCEYARNRIAYRFLQSDCDTLLMIDADMIVDGTVLDLLRTPGYDIAAPKMYMAWPAAALGGASDTMGIYPCAFMFDQAAPDGTRLHVAQPPEDGGINACDAVGTGVVAIKRRVLLDRGMMIAPDMTPPAFFQNVYKANGERVRGQDIDFCYRAGKLGYRIVVNWDIAVGHYKSLDVSEVEQYAQQAGRDEPTAAAQAGSKT